MTAFFIGDLVVLEKQDEFHIYEFAGEAGNEFVFMALRFQSGELLKQHKWNKPTIGWNK